MARFVHCCRFFCVFIDGNVQVDLEELREFLSEAGALELFGAENVREVMSIFDSDGNGTLEEQELKLLMDFIAEEKSKMLVHERKETDALAASTDANSLDGLDLNGDGQVDVEEVNFLCCPEYSFWSLSAISTSSFETPIQLSHFLKVSGADKFFGQNAAADVMKVFDSDG
jgi:hypothetical protein